MSVVTPLALYAVRIPDELKHVFKRHDDVTVPLDLVCDLNKLAEYLPLEDMFYLIYEQTTDKGFVEFMSETKLYSFLQSPENINWLNGVKDQYDAYIRKREDTLKVKQNEVEFIPTTLVTTTLVNETHMPFIYRYGTQGVLIAFKPYSEEDSELAAKYAKDKYQFSLELIKQLMRYVGYDELRKLPIMTHLLTIR